MLLAAVLFALYSGVITPGEVGAAGALGALVLECSAISAPT